MLMKASIRIMLIDDDPDDQVFFQDAVQTIGSNLFCELASTGQEAISKLEMPPLPDYIFMDLNMPMMNGFDCLVYLKNQQNYRNIPVIIFTTSKNLNDISRTQQLGAKWYMTKPDDFNVLCKKLEKIFHSESLNGMYII
jgi:CheY-like chemotaxis protein